MATVVIVGCGILGPVVAILLKKKGYEPIIVEKVEQNGDAGLSLALWPNGLKVLDTIGLAQVGIPYLKGMEYTSEGELLGAFDQSYFEQAYGFPSFGIRRTVLIQRLRNEAIRKGVPIHQGWQLQDIQETVNGVSAISKDGRKVEGSFLVGCDGLHSMTRRLVLQSHGVSEPPAEYTGIVTVSPTSQREQKLTSELGGFCPKPEGVPPQTPLGWYGDARYALTYEVDEESSVWAIMMPGKEESESWRQEDDLDEQRIRLTEEFAQWPEPVRDMIAGMQSLVKFGLYDRPELSPEHWFHGRCVLVGDAAHPASPHLGQGANQGLEDCWHLAQFLPDEQEELSTTALGEAFSRYAQKRQPRTTKFVKGARVQGQTRVTVGEEACKKRNRMVKKAWSDEATVKARIHELYKEPY